MRNGEEKLMAAKEVAEYLRLDEHAIYRRERKGERCPLLRLLDSGGKRPNRKVAQD